MPDISIIQNDSFEELYESDTPLSKVFFYLSLILFILALLAAFFFYFIEQKKMKQVSMINEKIKSLNIVDKDKDLMLLFSLTDKGDVLKYLRVNHLNPNYLFDVISESILPNTVYKSGVFNVELNSVSLSAVADSPRDLARQVRVYRSFPKISSYEISNVKLSENNTVSFDVELNLR